MRQVQAKEGPIGLVARWPFAWIHPHIPELRWPLRLLGVGSIGLLGLAAIGIFVGASILLQDTSDGWADLAGGIALGLGITLLIAGLALSGGVHWASRSATTKAAQRLGAVLVALALLELGAFIAWNDGTPLAQYVLVGMSLLGLVGAWLLSRSRSLQA